MECLECQCCPRASVGEHELRARIEVSSATRDGDGFVGPRAQSLVTFKRRVAKHEQKKKIISTARRFSASANDTEPILRLFWFKIVLSKTRTTTTTTTTTKTQKRRRGRKRKKERKKRRTVMRKHKVISYRSCCWVTTKTFITRLDLADVFAGCLTSVVTTKPVLHLLLLASSRQRTWYRF